MKVWHNLYPKITTIDTIFQAYEEFRIGKKKKRDVIEFERNREDNLFAIHELLLSKTYYPSTYTSFYVRDPKIRLIHKATVTDRIIHHIVSRELDPIFEPTFIAHSYACRKNRGAHKAVIAFQKMAWKISRNNTRTCWVVKCDVKKFFASVNHKILVNILTRKIKDGDFLFLLQKIIESFYSDRTTDIINKKGIPIGNLTSQFFSNIYLNELDQYVKHVLKVKYYIRYADDFVLLSTSKEYLEGLLPSIETFLHDMLDLELHPQKIIYRKFSSGVDFLGYIVFPYYILPRTKTKRRLLKKIRIKVQQYKEGKITKEKLNETIQSYLGYLSHANAYTFQQELKNLIGFWLTE